VRRRPALALTTCLLATVAAGTAAAGTGDAAGAAAADWVQVRLDALPTPEVVDALLGTGVSGVQYTDRAVYAVPATPAQVEALRRVDGVRSVEALPVQDRLGERAAALSGAARLQVVTAPGVRLAGGAVPLTAATEVVELPGDGRLAQRLARTPGVLHVDLAPTGPELEDEGSGQVLAGAASGTSPVPPGYRQFLSGLGVTGSGVTVAVVDDGLDSSHPELAGRIVARLGYGSPVMEAQGHGTHVAGIVGGKGAAIGPAGVLKDGAGLEYGLGIAPGVRFVDQPLIQLGRQASFPPPGGFPVVTRDAVRLGASLWNASWTDGGGTGVGYVANAAVLDRLVRDADDGTAGDQPFTLVFSAGNSGSRASTITSPKELKNGIVVASSRSHRAGSVDTISTFSSRGPARDGRIVPLLAAPGETVVSARAATGVLCTAPLSGTNDAPPPGGATFYSGCSGTSMASPQVAGAVALVTEWWRKGTGTDPSPAMLRALLVNGARDMGAADVPNTAEGWGRVDLRRTLDPATPRVLVDQSVVLERGGAEHSVAVDVAPGAPLRVTLSWTDVPGPVGTSRALVNDLDLVVTGPDGKAYAGNDLVDGRSVPGGPADDLNSTENVWLADAVPGRYTVTVRASDLAGDAVRGGTSTDQDFALVVSGGRAAS
jgi:subtilisin family serine protease